VQWAYTGPQTSNSNKSLG